MSYDYCLGCGVLLPPNVNECPICGYENSLGHYYDTQIDDDFLHDFNDTFNPDEGPDY
jgi:hypothetical protein